MLFKLVLTLIFFGCVLCYYDNEVTLECKGKKYENVSLTAYYPIFDDEDNPRSFTDLKGKKLKTLQDYIDDRCRYVTISMDPDLKIPYGTKACIPELNQHFGHRILLQVRDTSSDLQGSGYSQADICVRSEMDSYDVWVNRLVTLYFI